MNKLEELENRDIRERIEQLNLKHYQVAEAVGISPFNFSIWLRTELTDTRRRRVIEALEQLAEGENKRRYEMGNVIKTEAEADFRAEQLKVEAELRRFSIPFKSDSENYTLGYRHLFFPSKEIAQKAIDTVGADRIKKYYFGVED